MSGIGDSPSYKVPSETSDAADLGKYFHSPRAKNIHLWSNWKQDEESEDCPVLRNRKAKKNGECYSEPSETEKCHICNVSVPRTCHQKHNASDQHKNMKKIYEKVLDSVTKQIINTNKIPNDQDFGDDVYYCETCSKIVKLENRQKHETSDSHSKSENDLNIINDFYKLLKERKSYDDRKKNEVGSSEVNETRLSEGNEARLSEGNDTRLSEGNDARPSEGNEARLCEVNDARPTEANDARLSEMNDPKLSELNETISCELIEIRFGEENETISSELNESRFGEENETVFSELNEGVFSELNEAVFSDLNEAGPSGLNHLATERLEENNDDINNKIIDASLSSLDSDDDTLEQDEFKPTLQTEENIIETKTQTPKEEEKPSNDQEKYSFEEYVKDMINKYNLKVKLPVIKGDFIWMVAPNGAVEKISRYDFHSYKELMNNVYCQLCNKWLSLNTRNHDTTEKHVRKVFRPINDQFTRWLDTTSNHCVLCNEVVMKGSENHIKNEIHQYITEKILCKDCNTYIDCHKFVDHIDSDSHLNVVMSHNSIKDMISNYAYCKICQETMPKSVVKYHVNSKVHIRKTAKELAALSDETNQLAVTNNSNSVRSKATIDRALNSEYCDICNVNVPLGGMQVHTNGKHHKKIVNQNKNDIKTEVISVSNDSVDDSVTDNDNLASPTTINDDLTSATSLYSPNGSTSSLRDDVDNKINDYSSLTEYANKEKTVVRCKICSVNIIFVEKNIIEHMEGKNHIANANKPKMLGYNKLMFTVDNNKTELKCQVCGVNIPYVGINISEHIRGKNHEDAEIDLLKFHFIIKERSNFFCKCCEIQMTDYLEHINSRSHTLQLLQKYKIDNAEMRKYVYDDENINDPVSHRHRQLYNNLLKYNGIYKLEFETCFYCNTCKIKLGRISEIDHVLGEKHGAKIEKMNKLSALLEQLDMTDVITR